MSPGRVGAAEGCDLLILEARSLRTSSATTGLTTPKNKTPAKPNCLLGLTGVFSQAVMPPGHSADWHSSQPGFVYFLEVDASRALQSDFVVFVAVNRIHLALFQRFLVLKYTEIVRALVVVFRARRRWSFPTKGYRCWPEP